MAGISYKAFPSEKMSLLPEYCIAGFHLGQM